MTSAIGGASFPTSGPVLGSRATRGWRGVLDLAQYPSGGDTWALAWSLMAGAGFQLSERVILDLGYRFIDMGKAQSGTSDSSGFTNNPPVRVDDLTAHELKVGLRFHFGG